MEVHMRGFEPATFVSKCKDHNYSTFVGSCHLNVLGRVFRGSAIGDPDTNGCVSARGGPDSKGLVSARGGPDTKGCGSARGGPDTNGRG